MGTRPDPTSLDTTTTRPERAAGEGRHVVGGPGHGPVLVAGLEQVGHPQRQAVDDDGGVVGHVTESLAQVHGGFDGRPGDWAVRRGGTEIRAVISASRACAVAMKVTGAAPAEAMCTARADLPLLAPPMRKVSIQLSLRAWRSTIRKNGAPRKAVTTPRGISWGDRTVRARRSAKMRKPAPNSTARGRMRR